MFIIRIAQEGWYDCKITVYEDYGIFEEDGKEIKIFWQLDLEASTEEMIVFWAEDNEAKIVFQTMMKLVK